MSAMAKLVVECSSQPLSGTPTRFGQPGQMRDIVEVEDCWEGEDHRYFRVVVEDGSRCILRLDLPTHHWQIWHFERDSAV
jgi:hypothetical protein